MKYKMRGHLLASTIICGSIMAVFAADQAQAQEQKKEVQEIVVTGSRIARKDFTATSPIATVTGEQVKANADVTIDTYLNTLPQVNPSGTTTSNNPGNGGQSNINLRGLGANRNLVLIDGRRPMVSGNDLTVDLNTIPQALIERIEVITGGAGAAYGADAVSGAVNIILKKKFEGIDIRAGYSNSSEKGDDEEYNISIVTGGNFADGKGSAIFAFDRSYREAMYKNQRPFSIYATSTTGTPPQGVLRWASSNAVTQAAVDNLFAKYGVKAGDARAMSGRIGFNRDGSLFFGGVFNSPLDVQNFKDPIDISVNKRFYPDFYSYNFDPPNILQLPLDRYSFVNKMNYRFDNGIEVFTQAGYTRYEAATGRHLFLR